VEEAQKPLLPAPSCIHHQQHPYGFVCSHLADKAELFIGRLRGELLQEKPENYREQPNKAPGL